MSRTSLFVSHSQKFRKVVVFTCPENLGEWCFHVSRKSGRVLFSRVPKIWASGVFTSPENLGMCCFHVSRKFGRVLFSRLPKIWACVVVTSPENLGVCCFHVSRKSGRNSEAKNMLRSNALQVARAKMKCIAER
jgi:hypothetical protein